MPLCNTDNSTFKADTTLSISEGIRLSTLYIALRYPMSWLTNCPITKPGVKLNQRTSRFSYLGGRGVTKPTVCTLQRNETSQSANC